MQRQQADRNALGVPLGDEFRQFVRRRLRRGASRTTAHRPIERQDRIEPFPRGIPDSHVEEGVDQVTAQIGPCGVERRQRSIRRRDRVVERLEAAVEDGKENEVRPVFRNVLVVERADLLRRIAPDRRVDHLESPWGIPVQPSLQLRTVVLAVGHARAHRDRRAEGRDPEYARRLRRRQQLAAESGLVDGKFAALEIAPGPGIQPKVQHRIGIRDHEIATACWGAACNAWDRSARRSRTAKHASPLRRRENSRRRRQRSNTRGAHRTGSNSSRVRNGNR